MWREARRLGLPKALARRSSQRAPSEIPPPEGVPKAKTTASAPCLALMSENLEAVNDNASSQEIGVQPGSGSPLGRVRFIGLRKRSGEYTISGAAVPFTQIQPFG